MNDLRSCPKTFFKIARRPKSTVNRGDKRQKQVKHSANNVRNEINITSSLMNKMATEINQTSTY